jgi:exosortase/archaeosortase family protein
MPPILMFVIGFIIIFLGGVGFALLGPTLSAWAILVIILGEILFLQSSRGFRLADNYRFLLVLIISVGIAVFIDVWPLQLTYAHAASNILHSLSIPVTQVLHPFFGGLNVFLFVPYHLTGYLVGGAIDNSCAGVIALVPCFLLALFRDSRPLPSRLSLAVFSACFILIANLVRLVIELWLPAMGLLPWELSHYPLTFVLGVGGLIVIILAGQLQRTT